LGSDDASHLTLASKLRTLQPPSLVGLTPPSPLPCILLHTGRLRLGQASTEELLEDVEALEPLCCGDGAPAACFEPAFVAHRMGPYYPRIEYYRAAPGGRDLERL
jgi:hypothetical protein